MEIRVGVRREKDSTHSTGFEECSGRQKITGVTRMGCIQTHPIIPDGSSDITYQSEGS